MVDFVVAKLPDNFFPGKIGLKFVTETSPHSSHRSSQEAKKFVTSCSLWGQTHATKPLLIALIPLVALIVGIRLDL